jgi:antitoxin ParD1/3/4
MSGTERTTVVFTGTMAEELRKAVASGEYASTSEAVRHGVRLWMKEREERDKKLEWLRAEIQKGIDSGPGEIFEPGSLLKRFRARAKREREQAMAEVKKSA